MRIRLLALLTACAVVLGLLAGTPGRGAAEAGDSDSADLGSLPVSRIRLGDDSLRREVDQRFDDLVVRR